MSHAKRTYRVTFYLNDEEVHHLDSAVAVADMERAEYLRYAMLMGDAGSTEKQGDSVVMQESLTHAHRSIDRLETTFTPLTKHGEQSYAGVARTGEQRTSPLVACLVMQRCLRETVANQAYVVGVKPVPQLWR